MVTFSVFWQKNYNYRSVNLLIIHGKTYSVCCVRSGKTFKIKQSQPAGSHHFYAIYTAAWKNSIHELENLQAITVCSTYTSNHVGFCYIWIPCIAKQPSGGRIQRSRTANIKVPPLGGLSGPHPHKLLKYHITIVPWSPSCSMWRLPKCIPSNCAFISCILHPSYMSPEHVKDLCKS
jgi:hypothetical protein